MEPLSCPSGPTRNRLRGARRTQVVTSGAVKTSRAGTRCCASASKFNTDADRVPTGSDLKALPNFFTDPLRRRWAAFEGRTVARRKGPHQDTGARIRRFAPAFWIRANEGRPWAESVFWTAAASEARLRFGLDSKAGNLILSLYWRMEPKRRRRSALPTQSKEIPDCASRTSNL